MLSSQASFDEEGWLVGNHLKETFLEVDSGLEPGPGRAPFPPLVDGSAAAPACPPEETVNEQAVRAAWSDLPDAESLLGSLLSATTSDGAREMDGRKKREVRAGLGELLERFTVPEVVLGLGYWAGDRRLVNADILAEIVTRRLKRVDYDSDSLAGNSPLAILRAGLRLGEDERQQRLSSKAG